MISSEAMTFFYALRAEIKEEIYCRNCRLTLHLLVHLLQDLISSYRFPQ